MEEVNTTAPIDTSIKKWYMLKTNGINNIRSINASISKAPEVPNFWMAGFMVPRKLKSTVVLRKEFLFFDYTFVELKDPIAFEQFLSLRKIPSYFLYKPGTKIPAALTKEDIKRVKNLEAFKQLETDNFKKPTLQKGSLIEVCNGPFIGCKGVILETNLAHVVLEMNVFGRPTRVNVGHEFLDSVLQKFEEKKGLPKDDE